MLISACVMIFAMLHHPHGVSDNRFQITVMKWVHASLMFLLIFNTLGLVRLRHVVAANSQDMALGFVFYYVGLGSFLIATLASGFVQTSLIEFYKIDTQAFSNLSSFATILNQAFAKLGTISFGASGVFLFPAMNCKAGTLRLVGITGAIVGMVLVISIMTGVYLSVTTMTLLSILIIIWHCSIAVWLLNN